METATSTSTMVSSDPVSSLRAAALSTLKSKRRKAAVEIPVTAALRAPPPNESFQLDYGQEDNNGNVSKPDIIPLAPDLPENREKPPLPTEDTQMREEGEISDEEDPPLPTASNDQMPKPSETPGHAKSVTPEAKIVVEAIPTTPVSPSSPRSLTPEVQLQPQTLALMDRISDPVSHTPAHTVVLQQEVDSEMLDLFEQPLQSDLGPDRVRPGLELTQEEYDTVKDIILDLLGWGVPFDYLVECGLSKDLIYYVFNELDLRLPDTFDSSGIVPYTPDILSPLHQFALMPPPSIPERQRRDSIDSDVSTKMDTTNNAVTPPPSAKATSLPSVESPQSTDLHDMERRRRQELMARKAAVQASRKQKQSVSVEPSIEAPPPNESTNESTAVDQDRMEIPLYVATEAVEDFLNSLGTVQGLENPSDAAAVPQPGDRSPHGIEVNQNDQSTYGQTMEMDDREHNEVPLSSSSDHFSVSSIQSRPFAETPPSSSSEPPPSSVASTMSTFSQLSVPGPDTIPRRGVKRPVASDFVDFDPTPKRHVNNSRMERSNGTGGITRRLSTRTSFQNINSRRCVIDLSDSEDEDEGEEHPQRPSEDTAQLWHDKRTQPRKLPSPAPIKPISSGTMSPAVLEQKELEIRKMRELIAQREEETRLRKLALAKSASANYAQSSVALTPVSQATPMKVEEVDAVITPSTESNDQEPPNLRHSESATPPHPHDRSETHTPENPDLAFDTQEPQAGLNVVDSLGRDLPGGSVDADKITSPSAQMKSRTPTPPPVHRKQDAKRLEDIPAVNHDDPLQEEDTFSSYRSPFELYPLLRSHGQPLSSTSRHLSSHSLSHMYPSSRSSLSFDSLSVDTKHSGSYYSSKSSSSPSLPNLKPLRLATLAKLLDPFKRLCQYEVPGGGTCRDEGCEDIHLSRLEGANQMGTIEPNDEDTADYLFDALPTSWLHQHHVASPSRILSALQDIHRRNLNNPLQFEDRVSQALDSLSSPPTT